MRYALIILATLLVLWFLSVPPQQPQSVVQPMVTSSGRSVAQPKALEERSGLRRVSTPEEDMARRVRAYLDNNEYPPSPSDEDFDPELWRAWVLVWVPENIPEHTAHDKMMLAVFRNDLTYSLYWRYESTRVVLNLTRPLVIKMSEVFSLTDSKDDIPSSPGKSL